MQARPSGAAVSHLSVCSVSGTPSPAPRCSPPSRCPLATQKPTQLPLAPRALMMFNCRVADQPVLALFDPGAQLTLIKSSVVPGHFIVNPPTEFPGCADRSPLPVDGTAQLNFVIGPIEATHNFHVAPTIAFDVIFGIDWAYAFRCAACYFCKRLLIRHGSASVLLQERPAAVNSVQLPPIEVEDIYSAHRTLHAACDEELPPGTTRWIAFLVHPHPLSSAAYVTPSSHLPDDVTVADTVIDAACSFIPVTNNSDVPIQLEKDCVLAHIRPEDTDISPAPVNEVRVRNNDSAPSAPHIASVPLASTLNFDINQALPSEHQRQLRQLLQEFHDVFHRPGEPLRCTNVFDARLELHDTTLYYVPQYKLTPAQLQAAQEEVENLLLHKTIKEQNSHYCLSLLVVPRATPLGEKQRYRVVIDARPLNRRLKLLNFRGTPSNVYLDYLQKKTFYSQFDLKSSYQQIRLHPDSPGFPTHGQIALHHALSGLLFNGVVFYVDDGTAATSTWPEHLSILRAVFERFRRYGFVLNLEKCRFGYPNAFALGMVVSSTGTTPDCSRVRPVEHLIQVKDKKRAKGVVSYFSFFRKFIKNYAQRAHILFEQANPNTTFDWNEKHDAVVRELHEELLQSALHHFHEDRPSRLLADGSREGIGSVFVQFDPSTKKWHPIAHHSRMLTKTEKNYSMTAVELLAIADSCTHTYTFHEDIFIRAE
ncbi:hypothetical protein ONE63_011111 [Megalurothrips usitatus]|uniref:Reverse transcriptase/retrotransposon-derived protein RNase H-like domain-containing protein n=1 Tax=Megalurothrips usitatus TaxID=439358 RepID=A0AAV7XLM2_9NEOP|nr:hypothetical protein ONE63_011111 [Megalurothrips usitatus]